jgi:hypothetical protein
MQKRILSTATQLFEHAIGRQLIKISPTSGIKLAALMGPRPPIRKRVMLQEDELRKLLSSVGDIGDENGLALKIMLATCVRTVELVKARWEHIDFDRGTWFVPDESVKTRVGFLVPITPTVAGWFRELQSLAGGSPWVLPARDDRRAGQHVGRSTLSAALYRAFERGALQTRKFTPHDTRSTAKGHMRNLGVSREISEIALNHTLKGMEAVYDVRDEIPERRQALELWASFLVACEKGSAVECRPAEGVGNSRLVSAGQPHRPFLYVFGAVRPLLRSIEQHASGRHRDQLGVAQFRDERATLLVVRIVQLRLGLVADDRYGKFPAHGGAGRYLAVCQTPAALSKSFDDAVHLNSIAVRTSAQHWQRTYKGPLRFS